LGNVDLDISKVEVRLLVLGTSYKPLFRFNNIEPLKYKASKIIMFLNPGAFINDLQKEMVLIPVGKFVMGSAKEAAETALKDNLSFKELIMDKEAVEASKMVGGVVGGRPSLRDSTM